METGQHPKKRAEQDKNSRGDLRGDSAFQCGAQTDERPTASRLTINLVFGLLSGLAHLRKELRTLNGIKAATKKAQAELDAVKAKLASVANLKASLQ